jgi:hypothetical protein
VPLATIGHLADLGTHLARTPLTPEDVPHADTLPDIFTRDEGHTATYQYGETP